jgi:hypothetical protein
VNLGLFRRYPIDYSKEYNGYLAGKFKVKLPYDYPVNIGDWVELSPTNAHQMNFVRDDCEYVNGPYISVFGPTFANTGREFRVSAANFNVAITRQTCSHENARTFRSNQQRFSRTNIVNEFVKVFRRLFAATWHHDIQLGQITNALSTHPKRQLRITALNELFQSGGMQGNFMISRGHRPVRVVGQIKTNETIDDTKRPRLVVDMSTPASLVLGLLVNKLKEVFSELVIQNCRFTFVASPTTSSLVAAFTQIWYPTYEMEYVYFSDDAIIALRRKDGSYERANVDIVSCDSSHGPGVFELLKRITSVDPQVTAVIALAISQLRSDLYVSHIGKQRGKKSKIKQKVVYRPLIPVLYSGSILTTLINNLANILIGLSISKEKDIVRGAREAGYSVKCVPVNKIEDLQFLKFSPFHTHIGCIGIFLNLGVLFRLIGKTRGDLLGHGSPITRAFRFNCEIASSLKYCGDSSFFKAFCDKFPPAHHGMQVELPGALAMVSLNRSFDVPDHVIFNRYGVHGLDEVNHMLRSSSPGSLISHKFVNACMAIDYGFSRPVVLDYRLQPLSTIRFPAIHYHESL